MEQGDQTRTFPAKLCQIEGCEEISVGCKVPLCRKHRNKTYKQNYKKKKRSVEAQENPQEIVIDDQYLLEQKYSNMLQDVLTQKQMELFESPSVVNLLKNYQKQNQITRSSTKSKGLYSCKLSITEESDFVKERWQSGDLQASSCSRPGSLPRVNDITFTPALNFTQCFTGDWKPNPSSMSSNMISTSQTTIASSSVSQTSFVPAASTTFQ